MKQLLTLLIISVVFLRCVPFEEKVITEIRNELTDPVLRKIHDFQDRQMSDSLYGYFRHPDPTYRYAAALAFSSTKDTLGLDSLAFLLSDRIEKVRVAAAFSLGQIGSPKGELLLLKAFEQKDTAGQFRFSNAAILEAIGKIGSQESLKNLATISTYRATDTALLVGQAWGVYRFALREMVVPEGTLKMVEYATNTQYPDQVRLIASNYLLRAKDLDLGEASTALVQAFTREKDPNIRMALAIGLGKSKTDIAREALTGLMGAEQDYRVRCNMIRALGNFDYHAVKDAVVPSLFSKNLHVAIVAAQFLRDKGNEAEARQYLIYARDSLPWQTQMILYAAAHRHLPAYFEDTKGQINYELRRRFETSKNPYEQAAAIDALSEFGWNFRYIIEKTGISDYPVVRTAGIRALSNICSNPGFDRTFGLGSRTVKREIASSLVDGIRNGDPGVIAEASILLRNKTMDFGSFLDSLNFLEKALTDLKLPDQIETYNELQTTIAHLAGLPAPTPLKPAYNHPIDWTVIDGQKPSSGAIIKTEKGDISLKFLPEVAPGSVVNFIRLAKEGFFNGKNFHRVVPNFVIQGGCPRGDGYGALDYSIRSELANVYYDKEGKVGMASAGNHTEGTQFFVTHAPTPHLDGKYTIFAEVSGGMNVVHEIREGDQIISVVIN